MYVWRLVAARGFFRSGAASAARSLSGDGVRDGREFRSLRGESHVRTKQKREAYEWHSNNADSKKSVPMLFRSFLFSSIASRQYRGRFLVKDKTDFLMRQGLLLLKLPFYMFTVTHATGGFVLHPFYHYFFVGCVYIYIETREKFCYYYVLLCDDRLPNGWEADALHTA